MLVGVFNTSEKCWSVGMIIPNIWENKKCSKPPTINANPLCPLQNPAICDGRPSHCPASMVSLRATTRALQAQQQIWHTFI
jgi:hypothetical protein